MSGIEKSFRLPAPVTVATFNKWMWRTFEDVRVEHQYNPYPYKGGKLYLQPDTQPPGYTGPPDDLDSIERAISGHYFYLDENGTEKKEWLERLIVFGAGRIHEGGVRVVVTCRDKELEPKMWDLLAKVNEWRPDASLASQLRHRGGPPKGFNVRNADRDRYIRRQYGLGVTAETIANDYEISVRRVRGIVADGGAQRLQGKKRSKGETA